MAHPYGIRGYLRATCGSPWVAHARWLLRKEKGLDHRERSKPLTGRTMRETTAYPTLNIASMVFCWSASA